MKLFPSWNHLVYWIKDEHFLILLLGLISRPNLSWLFSNCSAWTSIPLSLHCATFLTGWVTANVHASRLQAAFFFSVSGEGCMQQTLFFWPSAICPSTLRYTIFFGILICCSVTEWLLLQESQELVVFYMCDEFSSCKKLFLKHIFNDYYSLPENASMTAYLQHDCMMHSTFFPLSWQIMEYG